MATLLAGGAVAALAYYVNVQNLVDEFATVAAAATFFSIGFWARKRPDQLRARLGVFGRIGDAARESQGEINAWVHAQSLRVGLLLGLGYGIAIVLLKAAIVSVVAAFSSVWIAVAVGAAVASLVTAPELWKAARSRAALPEAPSIDSARTDAEEVRW
ncbi:hypothetical protein [Georgenia yuyongxinii]|uniref:hypothetical protein n=1 Tax=Georgenia yuyongxinii TaxID=2589797 RepID=UPI00163DBDE6|nr:hypothetical protein [Georgenia yuyongxinii]